MIAWICMHVGVAITILGAITVLVMLVIEPTFHALAERYDNRFRTDK